jgi:uncharacterized repeat protein (TIGR01451 family)
MGTRARVVAAIVAVATSLVGTAAASSRPAAPGTRTGVASSTDADVKITAAPLQQVGADEELSTTLHVVNLGPGVPSNVVVSDVLPANVRILDAQPSRGFCTVNESVSCSLGRLYPRGTATVVVTVRPIAPGRDTVVAASVSSDLSDPDSSNNTASVSIRVVPQPSTQYVSVTDSGMAPSTVSIPLGWTVQWDFVGSVNHDVTDSTGLGLFASGSKSPGSYYAYAFQFAGGYTDVSTEDGPGFGGTVKVEPLATPTRGTSRMGFQLQWFGPRAGALPAGCNFDAEVQRPGTGYVQYAVGATTQALDFVPDAGDGTYRFRVRLRNRKTHGSSTYVSSNSFSVDPASPLQLVQQFGGAADVNSSAIAVDSSGNSYLAGSTNGTLAGSPEANAGSYDAFVAKYDTTGTALWIQQLGSTGFDHGSGIAVDAFGNAYITGYTNETLPGSAEANAGANDAFVAKYDTNGNRLWVHQLGSKGQDEGFAIAVDPSGNAYVTGEAMDRLPGAPQHTAVGMFVAEYDTDGNRIWVRQLGVPNVDPGAEGFGISVDASRNVYVTGFTEGTLRGSPEPNAGSVDAFVAKFDGNGNRTWVHQLGTSGFDQGSGIAVDASGNAYVTGFTAGTLPGSPEANSGYADAFVAKYDSNGNRTWVHQLGTNADDEGFAIAVDASGNALVSGATDATLPGSPELSAGYVDAFVAKYDSNGNHTWVHQLGSSGFDESTGIAVDGSGNAHVTGNTDGTLPGSPELNGGYTDGFLAEYLSTG